MTSKPPYEKAIGAFNYSDVMRGPCTPRDHRLAPKPMPWRWPEEKCPALTRDDNGALYCQAAANPPGDAWYCCPIDNGEPWLLPDRPFPRFVWPFRLRRGGRQ